jgi:DNA-binding XRE family transcriptional regulator
LLFVYIARRDMKNKPGMTQKALADEADVSLRMIQLYEQRNKDTNKASALTLAKVCPRVRLRSGGFTGKRNTRQSDGITSSIKSSDGQCSRMAGGSGSIQIVSSQAYSAYV